jgi:tetratricopeptide (TPR) repeat protein
LIRGTTGHAASAKRLFTHLLDRISPDENPDRYIIIGNLGYALTDLGEYDEAIRLFQGLRNQDNYSAWYALALAYAHLKRGDEGDQEIAREYVLEARRTPGYGDEQAHEYWRRLYPEFRGLIVLSEP